MPKILGGKQDNYIITKSSDTPPAVPTPQGSNWRGERQSQPQTQQLWDELMVGQERGELQKASKILQPCLSLFGLL